MYIYDLLENMFIFSNKKCKKCDGSGLMLLNEIKICKNCNGKICYKCEKNGPVHIYDECNVCFGKGII